jgi:hypothetical protein
VLGWVVDVCTFWMAAHEICKDIIAHETLVGGSSSIHHNCIGVILY